MNRSIMKQISEREHIAAEIMECMCESCHYPHILDEDALPAKCEGCKIVEKLKSLL